MSKETKKSQLDEFESMMEERIRENFNTPAQSGASASNDRLREMNKKLPSWSLEPPFSFLK
jgi:hypothetical protein